MLYTIAVILIILWLLGFFAGGIGMGAFIHLLLVIAVILIIFSLISGNSKI
ncbi:MAG: lmo0937 family membrane protein [Phycisphaerales bacterium]|nr:lmo0937 family membrane protein [Phycisphaerales bacterium]